MRIQALCVLYGPITAPVADTVAKAGIAALPAHQGGVIALFDNPAVVHHANAVEMLQPYRRCVTVISVLP